MAEEGQADARGETDIAGTDNANLHAISSTAMPARGYATYRGRGSPASGRSRPAGAADGTDLRVPAE
ncbi:hypothetical protein GCM10010109_51260 [Actinoplanes campanulatus]|nr:hypothetical protein GCM10010109_51260 [Actinoplanes campanulatus]GID37311.1 hypothetical protein Aca09nite_38170 [Actinoplanes campanulatus]